MRTVGKRKITIGYVVQTFNDEGKCIEQEFFAGDEVEWEGDDRKPIEADLTCEYQPFHMVQPQAMAVVLIGNLSDGYGAVGPFIDFDEATRWADGPDGQEEAWLFTLQNPYEEFDSAKRDIAAEMAAEMAEMRETLSHYEAENYNRQQGDEE